MTCPPAASRSNMYDCGGHLRGDIAVQSRSWNLKLQTLYNSQLRNRKFYTHTHSELILTISTTTHFLPWFMLLGFRGSASPPSQCTSNGSFSCTSPPSSTSPPFSPSELLPSSHPYPFCDLVRRIVRGRLGWLRVRELSRLVAVDVVRMGAKSVEALSVDSELRVAGEDWWSCGFSSRSAIMGTEMWESVEVVQRNEDA